MAQATPARDGAHPLPFRRAALCVLLPFVPGHFLSYLFRMVGTLVSDRPAAEFHLSPASLGLLNSAYRDGARPPRAAAGCRPPCCRWRP